MAGLVRKKVTVRSKKGKAYQRTIFVRAGDAVRAHGGKALTAAALVGAALLARKHQSSISHHASALSKRATAYRRGAGANLAGHLVRKGLEAAASHVAGKIGSRFGGKLGDLAGRVLGRKHRKAARELGEHVGEAVGSAAGEKLSYKRIDAAGAAITSRLRRKNLSSGA